MWVSVGGEGFLKKWVKNALVALRVGVIVPASLLLQ